MTIGRKLKLRELHASSSKNEEKGLLEPEYREITEKELVK